MAFPVELEEPAETVELVLLPDEVDVSFVTFVILILSYFGAYYWGVDSTFYASSVLLIES